MLPVQQLIVKFYLAQLLLVLPPLPDVKMDTFLIKDNVLLVHQTPLSVLTELTKIVLKDTS